MRTGLLTTLIFGLMSLTASASADRLTARASEVTSRLRAVEAKLHPEDSRYVERSLDSVMQILARYGDGGGAGRLICVSNGEMGSFEKFLPYFQGNTLGGGTSKASCQQIISGENAGLLCISNGQMGSFEKFSAYDLFNGKEIGGGTSLNNCLNVVSRAGEYVCVSNGQMGSFEKFQLVYRAELKNVGGETSLANCLEMLP